MGEQDRGTRPDERVLSIIAVLLTFASGASDVASFTRLGGVFTSVMTGNMVIFGLSLAERSASLATHTAVSFGGYVAGVSAGTRIAWHHGRRKDGGDRWPPHITLALLTELALFAGVAVGWESTGSRPSGASQFVILALAACAMGIQSATVSQMGLGSLSTTYLTGTLTGLVSTISRPDGTKAGRRRPAVLSGLLAGAVLTGLLVAYASAAVPFLALLAVGAAAALSAL